MVKGTPLLGGRIYGGNDPLAGRWLLVADTL